MNNKLIISIIAIFLVIPVLSGCFLQHSTETFSNKKITGDVFSQELARLYQGFASNEITGRDWKDAKYFSNKGLRAASGIEVDPEHPEDWDIPETLIPQLLEARRLLLNTVLGDKIVDYPILSARAYFYYDCWAEELEESQEENFTTCRDNFFEVIDLIQSKDKPADTPPATDKEEPNTATTPIAETKIKTQEIDNITPAEKEFLQIKEKKAVIPSKPVQKPEQIIQDVSDEILLPHKSFYIFFDQGSTEISDDGDSAIEEIVENIATHPNYEVTILGYISKSEQQGAENGKLADERAEAVFDKLSENDVNKDNIEYYGFSQPSDTIIDNENKNNNHRVEIYLK